ncbi:VOC family protein [Streptomyces sp. ICBB 8177]|uniref:VOC family protein n=1 Tax=Streptomyces sp. ICBB 8177 TaxID=563922 RepID=UPI000D6734DF|nr:VOC family protein [Streptomyces sp. ICBB 8177]PWI45696.1 glyoxalase [Streptomyces sp. ICBB 8177]
MPEVTAPYAPGTPCWVDLMAPDQQAALDFYRDLFGWAGEVGSPEMGGYSVCTLHGKPVAGIGKAQPMDDMPAPPTVWTTYLATEDADATVRAVTDNGGTALTGPHEMTGIGKMAVVSDPTGAVVGIWQQLGFIGAGVVNEPGALVWNELNTTDTAAVAEFLPKAFGITAAPFKDAPGYFALNVGGRSVGGMQALGDALPEGTPPHWLTYFSVDDTDSTVDALVRAGGSVLQPAFDMMAGRMAVVTDPQGAVFAVIATPPSS